MVLKIFFLFLCLAFTGCDSQIVQSGENKNPAIKSWIFSTLDPPWVYRYLDTQTNIDLSVVKGEYESLQLVLKVEGSKQLQLNRTNKSSPLIFYCRKLAEFEGVKDVLVPCGEKIELENNVAYLWITFYAGTNVPSGIYNEEIVVKSGINTLSMGVSVTVKEITLPQKSSIPIVFGVNPKRIIKSDSNLHELEVKKKEIFDLLLNYRISPYQSTWLQNTMRLEAISSPYNWNDERTLSYMSDSRFSALALPYWGLNSDELKMFMNQVESAGLMDKSYFYLWDEPFKMEAYEKVKEAANVIHSVNQKARILTTYWSGPEDGPYANDFYAVPDLLKGYNNIYCTSVFSFQDNESNTKKMIQKLGDNEEWWTYTCMSSVPGFDYNSSSIQTRAIMWRTWKENSKGYLFWSVNDFSSMDPLASRAQLPKGDGILVYPGKDFGVNEPVVSVRLERFRDGAEDVELLKMLEGKKGREFTEKILKDVYQSSTSISKSSSQVEAFRKKLISELLK